MNRLYNCCLLGAMFSVSLLAQWIPYTADYTESATIFDPNGMIVSHSLRTGTRSRGSNGSEITSSAKVDNGAAVLVSRSAQFLDSATGSVYKILYQGGSITLMGTSPVPLRHHVLSGPPLGTATVAGLPCTEYPIKTPSSTSSGKVCFYEAGDIFLKYAYRSETPSKSWRETDIELSDVKLGVEPDPAVFALPAGFKSTGSLGLQCSSCALKK
jgi:hypothetical protein